MDEGVFYGISEDDAFPSVPLVTTFSDNDGNKLAAWWLPWNAQENLAELATVNISVKNLNFTHPVMVDLLSGNVYDVSDNFSNQNNDCVIKNIGLADYPLLLVEKSSLKIQ
jgi:hypothetical protein